MSSRTLQDLIDAGVIMTSEEAVAIVRQLVASTDHDESPSSSGPPPDAVWIGPDGDVRTEPATQLSVAGLAVLLDTMLPSGVGAPVPGALRYIVARAQQQVDAPSFESIAELSAALSRHEHRERATILRELCSRIPFAAQSPDEDAVDPSPVVVRFESVAAASRDANVAPALHIASGRTHRPERRRNAPSVDVLRRQLRQVEAELYRARMQIEAEHTISVVAARLSNAPEESGEPVIVQGGKDAEPLQLEGGSAQSDLRQHPVLLAISALILSFALGYSAGHMWQSMRAIPDALWIGRTSSNTVGGESIHFVI